jgi:hypothetical protein
MASYDVAINNWQALDTGKAVDGRGFQAFPFGSMQAPSMDMCQCFYERHS